MSSLNSYFLMALSLFIVNSIDAAAELPKNCIGPYTAPGLTDFAYVHWQSRGQVTLHCQVVSTHLTKNLCPPNFSVAHQKEDENITCSGPVDKCPPTGELCTFNYWCCPATAAGL